MADSSIQIKDGSDVLRTVSTRTNASSEAMEVVMMGVDGSDSVVPSTAANGLLVDVSRVVGTVTVDSELTTADADTGGGTDTRAFVGLIGTGSGGGQLIPGDSTNGLFVNVQLMPGASRTTDTMGVAMATDQIMNNLTALTPKFAKANVSASTTDGAVVAAVTSKKIRVLSYRLHAAATATNCTFTSKPAGAGTACSELFACGVNGGRSEGFSPVGHFETTAGEGLSLTTGAGATVGVGVVYVEV